MKRTLKLSKRAVRRVAVAVVCLAALGGVGYAGYLVGHEDRVAEALDREVYGPRKVVEFVERQDGRVVLGRNDLGDLFGDRPTWNLVVADLPLDCADALAAARAIMAEHDATLLTSGTQDRVMLELHLQLARDMCIYWDYRTFMLEDLGSWVDAAPAAGEASGDAAPTTPTTDPAAEDVTEPDSDAPDAGGAAK